MKFEKVALIGCGLMGGSFALAAREAGWAQHIVGYSASASSRQKALSMGVINAASSLNLALLHTTQPLQR
jgi:prephenate dehydrogenase